MAAEEYEAGGPTEEEKPLLEFLTRHSIQYTLYRHPAVMTVAEAREKGGVQPGMHVKNMFLKDKAKGKRNRWVVTVPDDQVVDLKRLGKLLSAKGGLSFAKDLEVRAAAVA
jgi:Ala-tRNA(Pro) deacylase